MSIGINNAIKDACLTGAFLAMSACSAIPTAEQYALKKAGIDPNDTDAVQAYVNEQREATINRYGETTASCERRRSTGSNIGRSSCRSSDSSSQPVREGKFTPQPPVIPPGLLNRPGSN